MTAMQPTMDKLFEMRMTTMARAYRDLGDAPGTAGMGFDDLCVKKDEEWAKAKERHVKCDLLIIDDWMLEPLKGVFL